MTTAIATAPVSADDIRHFLESRAKFWRETIEATVAAALTFAAEYPDAPRAQREMVTA